MYTSWFIVYLFTCIDYLGVQWYTCSVFWKKWRSVFFITWLCRSAVRNYMHILTNWIYLWKAHIVNTFWRKFNRQVMSQRHSFSTVSCFRRFVSRDKISHYFDRFICQRLYYDAEIAWIIEFLNWYYLNKYIINVIADDETKICLYEIYFLND
jgi:hypothetical protein